MSSCPTCGSSLASSPVPPEPPLGTWVEDKYGAVSTRFIHEGIDGWSQPGCYPYGEWAAMWEARGPLVICGPWGRGLINA